MRRNFQPNVGPKAPASIADHHALSLVLRQEKALALCPCGNCCSATSNKSILSSLADLWPCQSFVSCQTSIHVSNLERICPMSMQNHLAELERRHRVLEKKIETEKLHPSADDLRLVELKRRKLALRDEIEKLRSRHLRPLVH
jgi:hypothetical protein